MPRIVVGALWLLGCGGSLLLAGCTEPTPNYCDDNRGLHCAGSLKCNTTLHVCEVSDDAAGEPGPDGSADRAADAATDRPADTTPTGDAASDRAADAHAGNNGDASADGDGGEVHTGCNENRDCTDPSKPVCLRATGLCVGCLTSGDCTIGKAGVCDTTPMTCVQCLVSSDCADPATPICDAKICRGCKVDAECATIGPGICMSHLDGHCATDDETVYVRHDLASPTHTCSDGAGAGSSTTPFCSAQLAIDTASVRPAASNPDAGATADAAAAGTDAGGASDGASAGEAGHVVIKDLVVMRGPDSLANWSLATPVTLTVVGQSGALINPGSADGITLTAGTLYLRGIRVSNGDMVGVVASGGELHMDRCVVDNNKHGGIHIDGAGYEITNSSIIKNLQSADADIWSGVFIGDLGNVAADAPARFANNTVANNATGGLVCKTAPRSTTGLILWNNGTVNATTTCGVVACCTTDPLLADDGYHLNVGSPCIDKLAVAMSTSYDIDGQARPLGLLSDCGADEYPSPSP